MDVDDEQAQPATPTPASTPTDDELPGLETDSSDEDEVVVVKKRNPTEDIQGFFSKPVRRGPKGGEKMFRKCRACTTECVAIYLPWNYS